MERYHRALNKVRLKVLGLPNVRGVGVGYKRVGNNSTGKPAIIVFVEKKLSKADLGRGHRVPPKLQGLETDVIEIGKVRLLGERTEKIRPAVPGSSIGHYKISAGTFGAVVRDKTSGDQLILSNNHILANSSNGADGRAKPGDPILQPGGCDTTLNSIPGANIFWYYDGYSTILPKRKNVKDAAERDIVYAFMLLGKLG